MVEGMTSPGDITPSPELSPDGRFYFDPHEGWQPIPATQRPGVSAGAFFWAIVAALAFVLVVLWVGYTAVTADDEMQCTSENVERSMEGLHPLDCPH